MKTTHEDYGRLWLTASDIHYQSTTYSSWVLPLENLRVLGEMTNENGPFCEDHFLVFVVSGSTMWYEAPFGAVGVQEFLMAFGQQLGVHLDTKLTFETQFASIVLWPDKVKGKKLFSFVDEPVTGLWGWIKNLLSLQHINQTYAPDIKNFLQ